MHTAWDGVRRMVCAEAMWRACVPPITAARASMHVRTTLLYASCSVREYPEVCSQPHSGRCTRRRG